MGLDRNALRAGISAEIFPEPENFFLGLRYKQQWAPVV